MKGVSQHKNMAMGQPPKTPAGGKFAAGGSVPMKTGLPTTPLTDAKRANGVPGAKKGGKVC